MAPQRGCREVSGMPSRSHPRPPVAPALLNAGAADTMWTNLGDWRDGDAYPTAAAALATRTGEVAQLGPQDVVVDYACGYGDSLRLWIERFGVRRVVGIEPSADVCAVVERRIAAWGLGDRIHVRQAHAESLPPRSADAEASAVVCVDAAYHFATRAAWWAMVASDLPTGARIACTDVLLADAAPLTALTRLAARGMRIPTDNLVSGITLRRTLGELALADVRIESIGARVLDGFVRGAPASGLALRVTRAMIRRLRRRPIIDYALVAARVAGCAAAG